MKKLLFLFGLLICPLIGRAQNIVYPSVVFVSTPSAGDRKFLNHTERISRLLCYTKWRFNRFWNWKQRSDFFCIQYYGGRKRVFGDTYR